MISLKTGSVSLLMSEMEISDRTRITDIRAGCVNELSEDILGNGYIRCSFSEKICEDGENVLVTLCFKPDGLLKFIEIYPQYRSAEEVGSFGDITEETLTFHKKEADNWLERYTGIISGVGKYKWGSIASFIDEKSFDAGIVIHYLGHEE